MEFSAIEGKNGMMDVECRNKAAIAAFTARTRSDRDIWNDGCGVQE